jgi:hypothetical protein
MHAQFSKPHVSSFLIADDEYLSEYLGPSLSDVDDFAVLQSPKQLIPMYVCSPRYQLPSRYHGLAYLPYDTQSFVSLQHA